MANGYTRQKACSGAGKTGRPVSCGQKPHHGNRKYLPNSGASNKRARINTNGQ